MPTEIDPQIAVRLRNLLETLGLKQREAAERFGIPYSTFKKYLGSHSKPDAEHASALIHGGVNTRWLLTGEGEMFLAQGSQVRGFRAGENPDYLEVPLFDVHVAAGHGAFNDREQQLGSLAFRREWVRKEISTPPDQLALVYVHGDSMEPELRAGDVVLVDRSVQDANRDGIYVLMLDEHLVIKRLQRLPDRKVRVSSSNAAYESFIMDDIWDDADHWIVGRAVWSGRKL